MYKNIDSILSVSHLQLRSRESGHDAEHDLFDIGIQVLHNDKTLLNIESISFFNVLLIKVLIIVMFWND